MSSKGQKPEEQVKIDLTSKLKTLANDLKHKNSEDIGPEVDDTENEAPMFIAGSSEENAFLAEAIATLRSDPKFPVETPEAMIRLCLRGRKYDIQKALKVLLKYRQIREELQMDTYSDQLTKDIASGMIMLTGGCDLSGRPIIRTQLRFHDPTASKVHDVARMLLFTLEVALRDPVAQQRGVSIMHDMQGVGPGNINPDLIQYLFGHLFPSFPSRVGYILVLNAPSLIKNVLLPIVFTVLRSKVKNRFKFLSSPKKLHEYVGKADLLPAYGGTMGGASNDVLLASLELQTSTNARIV